MKRMQLVIDIVLTVAVLLFLVLLIYRFFKNYKMEKDDTGQSLEDKDGGIEISRKTLAKVFVWGLGIRVAVYLLGYVFFILLYQTSNQNVLSIFQRWDANHYINLINNGYANTIENGQHLFLVFFPLFVWVVRPFALIIGNTLVAGSILSSLCFAWGCCWLYKLAAYLHGVKTAKFAVIAISVFPFSFFFGASMTEGLFFLTTTASIYHAVRHHWGRFAFWGILSALTRMTGVLVIIPAFIEFLEQTKLLNKHNRKNFNVKTGVKSLFLIIAPVIGTGIYLLLNYVVDGNAFAFSGHQAHWHQGPMWISRVLQYVFDYLKLNYNNPYGISVWYPTLILFVCVFAIMVAAYKKNYPKLSLLFYGFFYFLANYSLSWLLSAGRYMSCGFVYFIFLGFLLKKHENVKIAVLLVETMLLCVYLVGFILGNQIM